MSADFVVNAEGEAQKVADAVARVCTPGAVQAFSRLLGTDEDGTREFARQVIAGERRRASPPGGRG